MRIAVLSIVLMLAGAAAGWCGEAGTVTDDLLHAGWFTGETAAFANLKYTDTYTVLVFWSLGSVKEDEEGDDGGCGAPLRGTKPIGPTKGG